MCMPMETDSARKREDEAPQTSLPCYFGSLQVDLAGFDTGKRKGRQERAPSVLPCPAVTRASLPQALTRPDSCRTRLLVCSPLTHAH